MPYLLYMPYQTDKPPTQNGNKFRSIFSDNLQPIATRGKKAYGTLLVYQHCGNACSIKRAPLSVSYYNEISGGYIWRGLYGGGVLPAQYCPCGSNTARRKQWWPIYFDAVVSQHAVCYRWHASTLLFMITGSRWAVRLSWPGRKVEGQISERSSAVKCLQGNIWWRKCFGVGTVQLGGMSTVQKKGLDPMQEYKCIITDV